MQVKYFKGRRKRLDKSISIPLADSKLLWWILMKYWIWIWKKIKINVNDMKLWTHVKMQASKYYPNNITTACVLYFVFVFCTCTENFPGGGGYQMQLFFRPILNLPMKDLPWVVSKLERFVIGCSELGMCYIFEQISKVKHRYMYTLTLIYIHFVHVAL